jgi:anti-sigma28 factor (negative regulator of flagellin synthesis)
MRIYDRDLTGTAAADSGRAQETQKTDRDTSATSSRSSSASSGDSVHLSTGLASVARALTTDASDRASKVQQLATQFQSGTYKPNSQSTSQSMVAQALSGAK